MSEFVKVGDRYLRNNSDGSQHEVTLGDDGYFHWITPDGQKVRSQKKYKRIPTLPLMSTETLIRTVNHYPQKEK